LLVIKVRVLYYILPIVISVEPIDIVPLSWLLMYITLIVIPILTIILILVRPIPTSIITISIYIKRSIEGSCLEDSRIGTTINTSFL